MDRRGRRRQRAYERQARVRLPVPPVPRAHAGDRDLCFYFWSCANGYRQNEPEATEQLYREIAPTFVEDKDMVEAQQARLDELGEQGLVNIVSDANRVVMRRFIERLLADEKGALAAE